MKNTLINNAIETLKNAYSPYSDFKVGAALLCTDGSVYTGCNVENASYSLTCCAERSAILAAISDGKRDFSAIAVVGGRNGNITDFCTPCGACLGVLCEFCKDDFKIYLYNSKEIKETTLSSLMPVSFRL